MLVPGLEHVELNSTSLRLTINVSHILSSEIHVIHQQRGFCEGWKVEGGLPTRQSGTVGGVRIAGQRTEI